ncbi:MAG: hypothetical protein ACOYD4_17575 [Solirubrobacterales bacterium]
MRFSVLWHQDWMDPAALARPRALDRVDYQELFQTARRAQLGPLTVPWPVHESQGFWERYLSQWRTLAAVKAREAWRASVPLRSSSPMLLVSDDEDVTVATEGFIHPWGGTFVITAKLTGSWSLEAAAERVRELRREKGFASSAPEAAWSRLDDLAAQGLDALREDAGAAVAGSRSDGFAVFSLLHGDGAEADFDPREDATGAARFLHAVTSFSPTWASDELRPLDQAKVAGLSTGPPTHLIYGSPRARAIWSPAHFTLPAGPSQTTLGCHHRNLVLASMQTESLARFAAATADRLGTNRALSDEHRSQIGCAVVTLADLYTGSPRTYRSGSVRAQLDQAQLLPPINEVRRVLGLAEIA